MSPISPPLFRLFDLPFVAIGTVRQTIKSVLWRSKRKSSAKAAEVSGAKAAEFSHRKNQTPKSAKRSQVSDYDPSGTQMPRHFCVRGGERRTIQDVGAAPPQLPSARHVRVASPPLSTRSAAVQEYVATLPAHWSSLYEIEMPSTSGSDAHDTYAKQRGQRVRKAAPLGG